MYKLVVRYFNKYSPDAIVGDILVDKGKIKDSFLIASNCEVVESFELLKRKVDENNLISFLENEITNQCFFHVGCLIENFRVLHYEDIKYTEISSPSNYIYDAKHYIDRYYRALHGSTTLKNAEYFYKNFYFYLYLYIKNVIGECYFGNHDKLKKILHYPILKRYEQIKEFDKLFEKEFKK